MTMVDDAAPTGAAKYPRLRRWAAYFTSVCAIVVMAAQGLSFFTLPSCDADNIQQTIGDIFKEKNVALDRMTDIKQVSGEKGQQNCSARVQVKDETFDMTYRVYWDGWSKKVQIGDVSERPAEGATAPGK